MLSLQALEDCTKNTITNLKTNQTKHASQTKHVNQTKQVKQIKKKGNVLQTRKFPHQLSKKIVMGASPVSSFWQRAAMASMTVEAAVAVPLFLICVFSILSLADMMRIYMDTQWKLYETARAASVYGQIVQGKQGDWIRLKVVYPVSPSVEGLGFHVLLFENHCNVHIFNGYDASNGDQIGQTEQYVYVTQNGEVYHTKRSCQYINVSISAASARNVSSMRSKDGSKYYACPKCAKTIARDSIVYITDYGVKYHASISCPDLKRTVRVIPISEINGRPLCSGCGQKGA